MKLVERSLIVALLLTLSAATADAKRRVVRSGNDQDPAGWLAARAFVLQTVEHSAPHDDLEPLRSIGARASVVALGEATHGTREFYTLKLRMAGFLVREMSFDVIAFEVPLPVADRLDGYVQGGAADPRAILIDAHDRLGYRFMDVEEILAAVEWVRAYNAHRGDRPVIRIGGMDVFDGAGAASAVIAYLWTIDAVAAAEAEKEYACVGATAPAECAMRARAVRDRLEARRAGLSGASGAAYEDALQNARLVVQSLSGLFVRDENMAANVLWLRQHRSRSGRVVVWAHNEHVGKTLSDFTPSDTMGMHLQRSLGTEYVAIGMLTGGGTFRQWEPVPAPARARTMINAVPALDGSYESMFARGPAPAILIPLHQPAPRWLTEPSPYFSAGTAPTTFVSRVSLPAKFDAVVYVEMTRETTPLRGGGQ